MWHPLPVKMYDLQGWKDPFQAMSMAPRVFPLPVLDPLHFSLNFLDMFHMSLWEFLCPYWCLVSKHYPWLAILYGQYQNDPHEVSLTTHFGILLEFKPCGFKHQSVQDAQFNPVIPVLFQHHGTFVPFIWPSSNNHAFQCYESFISVSFANDRHLSSLAFK